MVLGHAGYGYLRKREIRATKGAEGKEEKHSKQQKPNAGSKALLHRAQQGPQTSSTSGTTQNRHFSSVLARTLPVSAKSWGGGVAAGAWLWKIQFRWWFSPLSPLSAACYASGIVFSQQASAAVGSVVFPGLIWPKQDLTIRTVIIAEEACNLRGGINHQRGYSTYQKSPFKLVKFLSVRHATPSTQGSKARGVHPAVHVVPPSP